MPSFAGENVLVSDGSSYGKFVLQSGGELASVTIDATSPSYALIVDGPSVGYLFHGAVDSIGGGLAPGTWFSPGTYFVYLVSAAKTPLQATLDFRGLAGSNQVRLDQQTSSAIAELPSTLLPAGVERFYLSQPFAGQAFAGLFTREVPGTLGVWSREWRMSSPDGIIFCFSLISQIDSFGSIRELGYLWNGGNPGPVNLSYFRQGAVLAQQSMLGYWVQRAPDDPPRFSGIFPAVGWSLTDANPLLDEDALCARSVSGQVLGGAPVVEVTRPLLSTSDFVAA